MEADEIGDTIEAIREEVFDRMISQFIPPESHDEVWDAAGLERALEGEFGVEVPVVRWLGEDDSLAEPGLREKMMDVVYAHFQDKEELVGAEVRRQFVKVLMLSMLG